MNGCPDYYMLADWDGREFWQFYRDECSPLVFDKLNDGEKHALQSACEHLFRRGLKGDEQDDLEKFRWWMNLTLDAFQPDDSAENTADYEDRIERAVTPVLALVELRRAQKLGEWYEFWPRLSPAMRKVVSEQVAATVWGDVQVAVGEVS